MTLFFPSRPFSYCLYLTFALIACKPRPDAKIQGYIDPPSDARWNPAEPIRVCWHDVQSPKYDRLKVIVQEAVTSAYGPRGFLFDGWQACEAQAHDLQVTVNELVGFSLADSIGKETGKPAKVTLSVHHDCSVSFAESNCVGNVAIHEFGHILGLHHEMNRPDQSECAEYEQMEGKGEAAAVQIGDFDSLSVMNYCRVFDANDRNEAISLSPGDIQALKTLYEEPFVGIEGFAGPVVSRTSNFRWDVRGERAATFRYLVSPDFKVCGNSDNYGPARPVGTGFDASLLADLKTGFRYKLCLLGSDDKGIMQSSYSSYDFVIRDEAAPELTSPLVLPKALSVGELFTGRFSATDETTLSHAFVYLKHKDLQSVYTLRLPLRELTPGSFEYEMVFSEPYFRGEYSIENLDVFDSWGNKLTLSDLNEGNSFQLQNGLEPSEEARTLASWIETQIKTDFDSLLGYQRVEAMARGRGEAWALMGGSMLWTASDSEKVWTKVSVPRLYPDVPFLDLTFSEGQLILVSSREIARSSDGGLSWQSTDLGSWNFRIVQIEGALLIGIRDDEIFRSTDFGTSWDALLPPKEILTIANEGLPYPLARTSPVTFAAVGNKIWACSGRGLWSFADKQWTYETFGLTLGVACDKLAVDGDLAILENSLGLFKLREGRWESLNVPTLPKQSPLLSIDIEGELINLVSEKSFHMSLDQGKTWVEQKHFPIFGELYWAPIGSAVRGMWVATGWGMFLWEAKGAE